MTTTTTTNTPPPAPQFYLGWTSRETWIMDHHLNRVEFTCYTLEVLATEAETVEALAVEIEAFWTYLADNRHGLHDAILREIAKVGGSVENVDWRQMARVYFEDARSAG